MVFYSRPKRYIFCMCMHSTSKCEVLLSSVNLSKDYHELLELIVCDRKSKECMIHRYESYPGVNAVKKFIEGELMKADDGGRVDDYDDAEITFHQWTTSDRAELISCTLPLDEFIEQLCEQLHEITFSSFHCKITISVSKQTKREPEMWWSDYPWRFCRKLLLYSARWNPRISLE